MYYRYVLTKHSLKAGADYGVGHYNRLRIQNISNDDDEHYFTLRPSERFFITTYWFNFLLHANLVKNIDDVKNYEFKEILRVIKSDDNPLKDRIEIYHVDLPISYTNNLSNLKFIRKNILDNSTRNISLRQKHDIRMVRENILSFRDSRINQEQCEYGRETKYTDIINDISNKFPNLNAMIKNLLKTNVILPVLEDEYEVPDKKDLKDLKDDYEVLGKKHITYNIFMKGKPALGDQNDQSRSLLSENSYLYWIDLTKLSLKHIKIDNQGDVNKDQDLKYSVLGNIQELKKDKNFYIKLMMKSKLEEGAKPIHPLPVFFMNNSTLLNSSRQPLIYNLLSYCRMGIHRL